MFNRHASACATITLGLAASALVATTAPASAADSDTTTTFSLTAGSLSISAPASKVLGSKATGAGTVSAALGDVTVTDNRGALAATWTASVASTAFTTGGATAAETIPASQVSYDGGLLPASSSPATGVFAGVPVLALGSANATVFTGTAVGNNTATWNPTVTVNVPAQAVVGTYSGTITHSVL